MADIEMIINVPEKEYKRWQDEGEMDALIVRNSLVNGIPLPKGHGRLKDIDWIDDNCPDYRTEDGAWCYKWEDIDNAPTLIEADTESEG